MAEDEKPARKPRRDRGEWAPAFLAALKNSANVRASCQAAGIARSRAYELREKDPEFAAEWERCVEDAVDVLAAEAFKRAREGSDDLLKFLLRGHRPSVYGDRVAVGNVPGQTFKAEIRSLADVIALATAKPDGDGDDDPDGESD